MHAKPTYEELEERVAELEGQVDRYRSKAAKYRSLFKNIDAAVFIHKIKPNGEPGELVRVNEAASEMLGYSEEEFKVKSPLTLDAAESNRYIQEVLRALREHGAANFETVLVDKNRRKIAVEINTVVKDVGGEKLILSVGRDITKRKQAESELKKLAQDQAVILDNVPAYIYVKDTANNVLRISKSVADITGLPKHEIEGCHASQIYPEEADRYWAYDLEVIASRQPKLGIVEPLTISGGERRWLLKDRIPVYSGDGEVTGVIVMASDITERINTEISLKVSEEKFRSFFTYAADAIYVVSPAGRLVDVNLAAQKQTGYSRNELLQMAVADIDTCFVQNNHRGTIFDTLAPGETFVLESWHRRKDGTTFPVEVHISVIGVGTERLIIGFVRDITEKESLLKNIQHNEEQLSLALQGANDGLWDWNVETDEVFFSPRWKSMLGYEEHEIKNHFSEWERLLLPEDRDKAWAVLNEYFAGNRENFSCEFRMQHKNGTMVHILSRAFAVFHDSERKPLRVVGTHVDLTGRKMVEMALKYEKEKVQSYLDLAGVIFIVTNSTGAVTLINRKGCEVLGYDYQEIIGKNWFDNFIPQSEREAMSSVFKKLLRGDTAGGEYHEHPVLTKNGEERLIAWHNTCLKDSEGNLTGLICSGEDISEKRLLEEKLKKVRKMESIGNLAGGIAHDFNNLLFPILGLSEMLLEDLPQNSPEYQSAFEIFKAGKRGRELVRQILTFSRQAEQKKMPVRIQQILKDVLMLCRASIPSDIRIVQDIQTECGMVDADSSQIQQICMNLITNAYHAVQKAGGTIRISLREIELRSEDLDNLTLKPGAYAELQVADTGHGIAPAIMDKIFEPYYSSKETGRGTGLGLAVVYGIVKDHDGDIAVQSRMGKGTIFSVYLPLKSQCLSNNSGILNNFPQTGTEKILLVDDEEPVGRLLKMMLERLGYRVTACVSSAEAQAIFHEAPDNYDLLITDMTMPGLTGDKLACELLAVRPDLPVLICTGFSERINEEKAKLLGIKGFLMKPTNKAELAAKVRTVLSEAKGKVH